MRIITNITKAIDSEDGDLTIEGMASTSARDSDGDIILPSAWNLSRFLKNPILLSQHNHNDPIGKVTSLSIEDDGLKVVAQISKSATKVATLIKEGILKSFSVGFHIDDAKYAEGTDIFTITDATLHELSVVSIGANENALFSIAKSYDSKEEYTEFKNKFKHIELDTSSEIKEEDHELDSSNNKEAKEKASKPLEEKKNMAEIEVKETGAEKLLKEIQKRLAGVEAREKELEQAKADKAKAAHEAEYDAVKAGAADMAKALAMSAAPALTASYSAS